MSILAMRILTVLGVLMSLVWWGIAPGPVAASEADAYWMCKTTTPVGWCPTSTTNPLPTTLASGTAIIGTVKIDQTTPGTTNGTVIKDSTGTAITYLAAGQAAMTNSTPVAIASDQSAIPVTLPIYTQITSSATGTTGATTTTLAGVSAKTTYICGFTITSDATAALAGSATITGTITGTMNFIQNVGSATSAGILSQTFAPCVPASAVNTGIVVNSVAAGTGGNTAVTAWGYQQ